MPGQWPGMIADPGRFESSFAHSPPSPAGLTRGSIRFAWMLRRWWMRGSSPRMTTGWIKSIGIRS